MPPRSKRTGEGSSSFTPHPKKAKKNQDAFTRDIFAERNLVMANPEYADPALVSLRQLVVSNSLRVLATGNDEYNETLVKEFYDSLLDGVPSHTKEVSFKVRRKSVTLNQEVIETLLELPHVSDDGGGVLLSSHR